MDSLAARFTEEIGRPFTQEDATGLNIDEIWNGLMEVALDSGRILTPTPSIWMMGGEGDARQM
jgi:hypothetical protein